MNIWNARTHRRFAHAYHTLCVCVWVNANLVAQNSQYVAIATNGRPLTAHSGHFSGLAVADFEFIKLICGAVCCHCFALSAHICIRTSWAEHDSLFCLFIRLVCQLASVFPLFHASLFDAYSLVKLDITISNNQYREKANKKRTKAFLWRKYHINGFTHAIDRSVRKIRKHTKHSHTHAQIQRRRHYTSMCIDFS